MKISVIIPVYNIAQFLDQCVQSVYNQTYSSCEIILIDDGSTDNSGTLCDMWVQKDKRICVYHKENGGLSDARNYGLLRASGDYIYYLDGDDWIAPNTLELLMKVAVEKCADFVQGGYYYAYPDYLLQRKESSEFVSFTKNEAMKELLLDGRIKNFAWGNLIRRDLALKVTFIKGKYFEDSYWKYQMIELAACFVYLPYPGYYYRQRSEGISGVFSQKNMDLLEGVEQRLIFISEHYPDLYLLALNKYWLLAYSFYDLSKKINNEELKRKYYHYLLEKEQKYYSVLSQAMRLTLLSRLTYFLRCHNCDYLYFIVPLLNKVLGRFKPSIYKKVCYQ